MRGQGAGIADGGRHHGGDGVLVDASNADDLQRRADVVGAVEVIHAGVGGREVGIRAGGLVAAVGLIGEDELEGAGAEIFIGPALLRGVDLLLIHGGVHRVLHLSFGLQAHGVHDKVGDLVVFVHKEDDLIIVFRPVAVEHIILCFDQIADGLAVLAGEHLLPDVHGGIVAAELIKIGCIVAAVHAAHHALQELHHVGADDVAVGVLRVDGKVEIVGILDGGKVFMDGAVRVVEVGAERFEIVRLRVGGVQAVHQVIHDRRGIDAAILVLDLLALGLRAHERCDHGGHIHGFGLDRDRVGRERILLHAVDVVLNPGGQRQDQRDTDDADGAGESRENRAALFREQVVQAEAEGCEEGHGRLLLRERDGRRFGLRLERRGVGDDLPVEQADGAGGVAFGKLGVVRDHDDELFMRDLLQDVHDLDGGLRVERAGRLVGQQDLGVVDKGAGNGHALHLAAGHLVRALVELVAEADLLQRLRGASAPFGLADAGERQRQLDILQHGLVRDEVIALEDEADGMVAVGVPVAVAELLRRAAGNQQVTGRILVEAADDVQ